MERQDPGLPIDLNHFDRAQINHSKADSSAIMKFSNENGHIHCIAQIHDADRFPERASVHSWLYDRSGGHGIVPEKFPPGPNYMVGYAGGINPDNVLDILDKIEANYPFWIDMETGVRDENDKFDLNNVEKICKLVYEH